MFVFDQNNYTWSLKNHATVVWTLHDNDGYRARHTVHITVVRLTKAHSPHWIRHTMAVILQTAFLWHFFKWKSSYLYCNSTEICSYVSNWQKIPLFQITAWRRTSDNLLPEIMMVLFIMISLALNDLTIRHLVFYISLKYVYHVM